MTKYIVQGGHPLFGEVEISGAKNAAVAIIPAALLVDGVCRIENIPQISAPPPLLRLDVAGGPFGNMTKFAAAAKRFAGRVCIFFMGMV